MTGEPLETSPNPPATRPAVWPWLLIPLVALTLFFALQRVKSTARPATSDTTEEAAPAAEP